MTDIASPIVAAADAPVPVAPASVSDSVTPSAPANPMLLDDAALAARYGVTDTAEPEPAVVFGNPEPDATPEPVVAEAAPAPEPPAPVAPITPFAVFDAEGEVEIPPLLVSFKAGGKDYEKVPLDRVVRMAQSAPLAEKFRADAERVPVLEQTVQQITQEREQGAAEMAKNNALYERMLADPEFYVQAVEAYQRSQSPEARAERAEREAKELRAQQETHTQQQTTQRTLVEAMAFTETRIAPAVDVLVQHYAGVIDPEEFSDRFHTLTADLMAIGPNGSPWVPPHLLPEVERRVQTDLAAWAKGRADRRSQSRAAVTEQATTKVQQAQAVAHQAKRQLARAALPARAPVAADTPRPPVIKTATDAVDAAMQKVRVAAAQYR